MSGLKCGLSYNASGIVKGYTFNGKYFPLRVNFEATWFMRAKGISAALGKDVRSLRLSVTPKAKMDLKIKGLDMKGKDNVKLGDLMKIIEKETTNSIDSFLENDKFKTSRGTAGLTFSLRRIDPNYQIKGRLTIGTASKISVFLADKGLWRKWCDDERLYNFLRIACGAKPMDFTRLRKFESVYGRDGDTEEMQSPFPG